MLTGEVSCSRALILILLKTVWGEGRVVRVVQVWLWCTTGVNDDQGR